MDELEKNILWEATQTQKTNINHFLLLVCFICLWILEFITS